MMSVSDQAREPVNPASLYASAFVDELQRAGVQHVVICPGSRSTPLAMACAAQPGLRVWMHVDERSAAFFGLGMAKGSGRPVALLCTSGTAAANFLPAIVEAKLSHVPLLVLTADRPHELRDNGAPQSIDQNRLYGTYVKWFVDVALPEATGEALRYIRTLACRVAALTFAVPAGPVHLNFPFREPLTPEPIAGQPAPVMRDPIAWEGRPGNVPYVAVEESPLAAPSPAQLARLAEQVRAAPRGLIVAGPCNDPALVEPLVQLARRLGYPILADPLSQLRCGTHDREQVIPSYDAFLRVEAFVERAAPELVLRFGAMPTSKPLLLYLKRYADDPLVVVDGHGTWEEPTQLASEVVHADPASFCRNLLAALEDSQAGSDAQANSSREWLATWQHVDQLTRQALQDTMQAFHLPFEGRVFSELADLLPDGATLFVGSSMPVRDMDTFFWGSERRVRIMANRGANGIDGVVSSALGASAVGSEGGPAVLVIGDLSFFHDLNGLLAARLHRLNLTIVLVNNDGGGIFSFLPQAAYPEHFEQLFGTPTGLDFRPAVEMYGGHFHSVGTWEEFRQAVLEGFSTGGLRVIEVPTGRSSNVAMHRRLWQAAGKSLVEIERES
jgi:2-succinyl-5-enolpyruvyl-6-hydroxy-3-cyclohexene-1-carboxylate synthase